MTSPKRVCQHNKELFNRDDSLSESTESIPRVLSSSTSNSESLLNAIDTQNLKLKVPQKDLFARLPNELFESVLKRVEVQNLLSLRLVNPRWLMMIESICKTKRSLALVRPHFSVNLQNRFDGQLNLSLMVYLRLESKFTKISHFTENVDLRTVIGKLFPRIEHLFVDNVIISGKDDFLIGFLSLWSTTLVTLYFDDNMIIEKQNAPRVCTQINALTNLKNLDLPWANCLPLDSLIPTLKRLHSLAIDMFGPSLATCELLVNSLGPNCTKLRVDARIFNYGEWVATRFRKTSVTHLHINVQMAFVVDFIFRIFPGQFGSSLTSLHITNDPPCLISSSALTQLSSFPQLSDIRIGGSKIHLSLSLPDGQTTPMPNIRSLTLANFRLNSGTVNDVEVFCKFFSAIFPSLERLTLRYQDQTFGAQIQLFINLFKALRYHDISFVM